jgi:hypothetical protein
MDAISIVTKPESKILTSRTMKDVNLRYAVDSGVCETTQGVHQMSGYIDVGKNMSMVGSRFSMQKVKTDFTLVNGSGSGFSSRGINQRMHHSPSGTTLVVFRTNLNSLSIGLMEGLAVLL